MPIVSEVCTSGFRRFLFHRKERIGASDTSALTGLIIGTSVLTGLIMAVLKSNTLNFGERFFIKLKVLPWGSPWL